MARTPTREPDSRCCTICLPVEETDYSRFVTDLVRFREWWMQQYQLNPELFPEQFHRGFCMKD